MVHGACERGEFFCRTGFEYYVWEGTDYSMFLPLPSKSLTLIINCAGMVQVYTTLAAAVWWLMLTVALFWKIWFPFNARHQQSKGQIKYIHLGCGLTGLLVPLIPVIAHVSAYAAEFNSKPSNNVSFVSGGLGFTSIRFPPVPCNGRSEEIIFYTNILPADIMLGIGITLITLIFWMVHKVSTV